MAREKKRLTVIFIVFLIIFSFVNQIVTSNVKAEQINETDNPRFVLLKTVAKLFGILATIIVPIFRLVVIAVAADPPTIEIGINETINVEIGMWDVENDSGFQVWPKPVRESIFTRRYLDFQVIEYPGGSNDQGSWFITFNPASIDIKEGTEMKTNVSISLTSPPSASNPIQSGMLKIRLLDTWAYGNLYRPPPGTPLNRFPNRFFWFLSATILMRFGKYSGTVDTEYEDVNILVKVKPYHALKVVSVPLIRLNPDQITSIPISLQNLGNYNDTYSFRIASENNDIKLSAPYSITLAPGETKNTYLGVSIPQDIFDYGTIRQITIEAYSIDDPNVTIAKRTINIESRGIYISEIIGGSLIFLIIIIILGVAFFIHRRRIFLKKYCIKPDKPWEIPIEKRYLDKLKKSDEERYNEVSKMMQDEYESALLWYKYYCKEIIEPKLIKKKKIKKEKIKFFKKEKKEKKPKKEERKTEEVKEIEPKEKKKPTVKKILKEEKLVKPEKLEKKKVKLIDKKIEAEKRRRQQVLSRIKREQEKQKRKFE